MRGVSLLFLLPVLLVSQDRAADDYIRRGNPYESSHVKAAGSRVRESISIRSESIIAGRTRVQTTHATPKPMSTEVANALT